MLGVLATVAVVGAVIGAIALVMRGGRGMEWAPRSLVRVYLYIASLAGIVVLVVGLSGILTAGFAAAFGDSFVYGDASFVTPVGGCPPTAPTVKCVPGQSQDFTQLRQRENARRRANDLIRGLTFTVFGALFWGAHRFARRGVMGGDETSSGLRRGYLMLGTVVFGLTTVVLLPTGIYQALSYLLLPAESGVFRPGVGDALAGGLVTLPIWLTYLRLAVREIRSAPTPPAATA
ncbi:MAG: hypothetical protein ACYC9W_07705 [Candidatus Limnocylindria bacterium]